MTEEQEVSSGKRWLNVIAYAWITACFVGTLEAWDRKGVAGLFGALAVVVMLNLGMYLRWKHYHRKYSGD